MASRRNMLIGGLLACLLGLASSAPAIADDIALQRGQRFSLYAPSSCQRRERERFTLVLDCNFRGKAVVFYLKEFPGQLGVEFDPRENPPTQLNQEAYRNSAWRAMVDDIDPGLRERVKAFSWGSKTGQDVDGLVSQESYVLNDKDPKDLDHVTKCVFLRVQTYRRGFSGVPLAVSDVDGVTHLGRVECNSLPAEVPTILGSLGGIFEGGRSTTPH
jgi:hypothetical protein